MAELPRVPRRLGVVTEAPNMPDPSLYGSPFRIVGKALDDVGDTIEALAKKKEQDDFENPGPAAAKAVTRDKDGKLQVSLVPEVDRGTRAINRLARQGYVAGNAPEIELDIGNLRRQHEGKPDDFKKAADEYLSERLGRESDPELRQSIDLMVRKETAQHWGGLLTAKEQTDATKSVSRIKAETERLDNEMAALARQGGAGGEAYGSLATQYGDLQRELAGNPRTGYSQADADRAISRATDRHKVEAFIGRAEKTYETQGIAAAEKEAEDILWNKDLDLDPAERRQYYNIAVGHLGKKTAEDRAAATETRQRIDDMAKRYESGEDVPDTEYDALIDEAKTRGVGAGAVRLSAKRGFHKTFQPIFSRLNNREQAEWVQKAKAESGAAATPVAGGRSEMPAYLGKLSQIESGGDSSRAPTTSSARGEYQFIEGTWLGLIKRHRPDLAGQDRQVLLDMRLNKALSDEMATKLTEDNSAALQRAGVSVTDGTLYLAHFLGAGGAVKLLGADPNASAADLMPEAAAANANVFKGKTVADVRAWADQKMGSSTPPAASNGAARVLSEALSYARKEIATDATKAVEAIEAASKKGIQPGPEEREYLDLVLPMVNDADLTQRARLALGLPKVVQEATAGQSVAEQKKAADALRAQGEASGIGVEQRLALEHLDRRVQAGQERLREDPLGTVGVRFNELDFSAPERAQQKQGEMFWRGIAERTQAARAVMEREQIEGVSPLRPGDRRQFIDAITRGDGRQAGMAFGALASLPEDMLRSTLDSKDLKESVAGAARSSDPARAENALMFVDSLWTRSPREAEQTFGKDVIDRMQTWQARLRYFTPEEMRDYLRKQDDPQVVERKKALAQQGARLARKKQVSEVIDALDPLGPFNRPGEPDDEQTRNALMADFETLYADRFADGVGEDKAFEQAAERLATKWGRSDINGGRLTLHRPESAYPQIGRSHEWMTEDLENDLTAKLGDGRWSSYTVLPDRATETDRARRYVINERGEKVRRYPGYLIVATDPTTGKTDLVRDDDGAPLRYRWSPDARQAAARGEFEKNLRENQGIRRETERTGAPPAL